MASITYLLEKHYNLDGILCKPGNIWHRKLRLNRKCHIDNSYVYTNSNSKITFF